MGKESTIQKILAGTGDRNIRFDDLKKVLGNAGFEERIKGDHHIFTKEGIAEIINLQQLRDGKAKPYQVKQVRNIFVKYKLTGEV